MVPFHARPRRRLALALTLALSGLSLPADAQTAIRAVTLSTAGLAMIEAEGRLGAAPLELSVARGDIDDLLKSLWLVDPAGAPARLTMPGPGAFDDAFANLPLAPEDVREPARLLAAMVGAPIAVERRGERWEGINMGVSERPCEYGPCTVLSLQGDDGTLRSFELGDALSFGFTESADRAAVAAALAAWRAARSDRRVTVTIGSDDTTERPVGLVWLQEAPLWRTAWRAVDTPGGLHLVGWAVVENATGLDWDGVRLTLATGAIRALESRLYERRLAGRELADMAMPVPVAPAMARGLAAAPMAEMSVPAVAGTETDDGASFSRFTLEAPVTLAAGQMISLPFLSQHLEGARLTLHRGGSGDTHPEIALEITNPLPLRLPQGVLTLYEEGRGHAGDAMIPELAPGATAQVRFARDTAMEIREETTSSEFLREMRLVRGVLQVTEDLERRTTYRIAGAPQADRMLVLDHPRRSEWAVTGPDGAEERLDAWRWRIEVPAGETVSHTVSERQPRLRRVVLMDIDLPTLAGWQGRATDPAMQALLAEFADLRAQVARTEAAARRTAEQATALEREQTRLVNLIVQLGDDSTANRERRARVDAIDAEIAALEAEGRRLVEAADALRARIAELLAL